MTTGYHVNNAMGGTEQALSSTYITLIRLVVPASAGKRFGIYDIETGQDAVPNSTDCPVVFDLTQCDTTGAGTGTSTTPFNGTDTAVTTCKGNYTAEPTTYTAASVLWHRPINQRASAHWQDEVHPLIVPATASAGPGLRAKSPDYTGTATASLRFEEY